MEPLIKLDHIDFWYDKGRSSQMHALKDVDLEIAQGEYVSFFGPSGCGKSTLLYIIAGIEKLTDGHLFVNGHDLSSFSLKELAIYRQIAIGIIFQGFNLIPSISNLENVMLPMSFLGTSRARSKRRALELFDRLGVAQLAERYPYELSGGQQQRVGIARALANDPPIILADEPIGNLDSENAANVLNLLQEFHVHDRKTIILVTHETWSLRDVGRVFSMRDGAIVKMEQSKKEAVRTYGAGKYWSDLFPELPAEEVRAKGLAHLLLRGYSGEEMKRFETFVALRMRGKMSAEEFVHYLDMSYREGGLGLWRQKARHIAELIEGIILEEQEIAVLYKKLEKSPQTSLQEDIVRVRAWLLEGFHLTLSPLQCARLDEAIDDRLRNVILREHFQRILDLPQREGGVGLRVRTSFKMADKFEAILARA